MDRLSATSIEQSVQSAVVFFETLQPQAVAHMGQWYAQDVYFKDPFNEVHGLAQVQQIFLHMYVALDEPHFVVTERVVQGVQCFLVWDFKFRFKRFDTTTLQTVRGTSMQLKSCMKSYRGWAD
jgi:steroid Delta-isomerase